MGITTEFSHHEASPGQQEIDLRHTDALTMADNIVTFKYIVKTVAESTGVHATFMPKPFPDLDGSAMHTHFSLFEGETNAFHDPDDEISMSKVGRQFIAGIIEHANEISAVTNQWVNSYKRLQFGSEAPTAATWGISNRSAMVRVPTYRLHKAESRRIEVRSLDSACNPYLAFAAMLMAGIDGIKKKIEPLAPVDKDLYELPPEEAANIPQAPTSLSAVIDRLEEDHDYLTEGGVFTEDLIDTWISYKRENEIMPIQIRPHPYEFALYYDV